MLNFDCIIITLWLLFLLVTLSIGASIAHVTPEGDLAEAEFIAIDETTYPLFQDVHIVSWRGGLQNRFAVQSVLDVLTRACQMIFIGFGMLYAFLKHQSFGSVAMNFLFGVLALPTGIVGVSFFRALFGGTIGDGFAPLHVVSLLDGDFCAAAVLITLGGVLGRVSVTQGLIMTLLESIFYSLNIGVFEMLEVNDIGGSIAIHAFGAFFGLAFSYTLLRGTSREANDRNFPSKTSNVIAFVGTLFLWCYWPSFNGALASGEQRTRVVVNTVLSLCACCAMTFGVANTVHGHYNAEAVLNATLAGGVAIGASCDLVGLPFWPILVGSVVAVLSVVGFSHLSPWLKSSMGLHDTCGILNLHGVPGVLGGLCGAIGILFEDAKAQEWSPAPRSIKAQAGYEVLAIVITLAIAIVSGLFTGVVCRKLPEVPVEFSDKHYIRPTLGDTAQKKRKTVTRSAPIKSLDHTQVAMQQMDDVSQDEYELDYGDYIVAKVVGQPKPKQAALAEAADASRSYSRSNLAVSPRRSDDGDGDDVSSSSEKPPQSDSEPPVMSGDSEDEPDKEAAPQEPEVASPKKKKPKKGKKKD